MPSSSKPRWDEFPAGEAKSKFTGTWGNDAEMPMTNDVAERIKQQTHENIQRRLRDQLTELQTALGKERTARNDDAKQHDLELDGLLLVVDNLLEFIQHNCGEIPQHLLELIAERQERRMLKLSTTPAFGALDLADTDAVTGLLPAVPSDGQIIQRTGGGKLGFVNIQDLQRLSRGW